MVMNLLVLLVLCAVLQQGCFGRYLPDVTRSAVVIRNPELKDPQASAPQDTTNEAVPATPPHPTPHTPPAPHVHSQLQETQHTPHSAQTHALHFRSPFSYPHRLLSSLEDSPPQTGAPSPPQDEQSNSPPTSAPESEPSDVSAPGAVASPGDDVAVVSSARDLWQAVSEGLQHIEVQAHLNLATDGDPQAGSILFEMYNSVRSLRGNCTTTPTAAQLGLSAQAKPLRVVKPGQCVLVVNRTLLKVVNSAVWVHGLYMRILESPSGTSDTSVQVLQDSLLWMTRVTLQGSGDDIEDCTVCGFSVSSQSQVFADGCLFTDFDTNVVGEMRTGGAVSMLNCAFAGNSAVNGLQGGAVLSAHSSGTVASVPDSSGYEPVGGFRLEGCTFTGNSVPHEVLVLEGTTTQQSPTFYSDSTDVGLCALQAQCLDCFSAQSQCLDTPLSSLKDAPQGMFLPAKHEVLLSIQEEVKQKKRRPVDDTPQASQPPESASPTPPSQAPVDPPSSLSPSDTSHISKSASDESESAAPKPKPSGNRNNSLSPTIIIPVVLAVLLLGAAIAAFLYRRRRARQTHSSGTTSYAADAHVLKSGNAVSPQYEHLPPVKSSSNPLYDPEEHASPSRDANTPEASYPEPSVAPEAFDREASLAPGASKPEASIAPEASVTHSVHAEAAEASSLEDSEEPAQFNMHGTPWQLNVAVRRSLATNCSDGSLGLDSSGVGTTVRACSPRRTPPTLVPSAEATLQRQMKFVHQQLDCFGPGMLLLRRYLLLGSGERRCGAQTVVQFAKGTINGIELVFALKFFTSRAAFIEERKLYKEYPAALREFMPDVMDIIENKDESLKDPFDNALPPFIVMEKGESLRDRASSPTMDDFTIAQVLGHVSRLIEDLHATGYVHRDLKPGNIIWEPHTCTWVLIDFGLVAIIGQPAVVGFTPTYAAPEAAKCFRSSSTKMVVDTQLDAWALGVIALELMLAKAPFGPAAVFEQVIDALVDPSIPLPWEGDELPIADKEKLGGVLAIILPLLHRDPSQRGSVAEFRQRINKLVEQEP